MADINENIGEYNISGINTVEIIAARNIDSIPDPSGNQVTEENITLVSGKSWDNFYGTPGTIVPGMEAVRTEAGIYYKLSIKLRYPKDQASVTADFAGRAIQGHVLKITDNNGTKTLWGEKNNPMYMSFSIKKPGEVSGYNGYEVEFTGTSVHPPYYLV